MERDDEPQTKAGFLNCVLLNLSTTSGKGVGI
jgi:hypothetical protein